MKIKFLLVVFYLSVLTLLFSFTAGSDETVKAEEEEMMVKGVAFDQESQAPVVILSDKTEKKVLPIWIGLCEARSINLGLSDEIAPRPLTYDLIAALVRTIGAKVDKIVVVDLRDGVFYAQVEVSLNGKTSRIDARPSDALALALRIGAPIFVRKAVLEKAPAAEREENKERGT